MTLTRTIAAAVLMLAAARLGAQPAPYRRWRTLDTPHFRVHAPAGLEREGRVAAAAAERAYALLARELVAPRGPIDIVVSDDADYANGSATPYPGNRIIVFATPPIESPSLSLTDDWLGEVVTHELTHVFHLDRSRGIWAGAQRVLGRAPFLFPNIYSPAWFTEGLAVYYETRLTEGGRLRSAQHRTWARAAALDDRLPRLGDLSLATPRYPGGEGVYGYGSLFVEYLAARHGAESIPRFVEEQSAALVPLVMERSAHHAFDAGLASEFGAFRDSVRRGVVGPEMPLAPMLPVTTHAWRAGSPRWVNDSTLVYTGGDGRESNAAWTVTLGGRRTRLGRRAASGANVPLPGGGVLYAELEFVGRSEVRSDLWVEREGHATRLTRGARFIQPDVAPDGRIAAVELAAARGSLVLLDRAGRGRRVLREAAADEAWSEPRWSPDGRRIVAAHRLHGGDERIEILDAATGAACTVTRGPWLLTSPAWLGPNTVTWLSERTGWAQAERADGCGGEARALTASVVGIAGVEPNPRTGMLALVTVHADGERLTVTTEPSRAAALPAAPSPAPADTQPLAGGTYRAYSPWPSLRPTWWLPVIEAGPGGSPRLGALTAGNDVVGRHAYAAYAAVEASLRFATGQVSYRYSGLRQPLLDVSLSQDWTGEGTVRDAGNAVLGTFLKRTQDLSLAATVVRPRVRSFASASAGLGVERRRFATDPAPLLAQLDSTVQRDYTYPRAFVSASFSNAQRPRLAISPEDGIALAATVRERYRTDAAARTGSTSLVAAATGYRALDLGGFAHQVLALRVAGGWADAHAASSFEVGGTSGASVDVAPGVALGEGRRTFGVRGFPAASLYGTSALAGSAELRAALALGGVGSWPVPAFFDRSSVSAFVDAGSAGCAASPLYLGICSPAGAIGRTIGSVGAEVGLSAALLQYDAPELVRVGLAVPIAGRDAVRATGVKVPPVSAYVAFGFAF